MEIRPAFQNEGKSLPHVLSWLNRARKMVLHLTLSFRQSKFCSSAQNSSAHCCLRQKLLFVVIQMGKMQHVRALQTNCSSQTRGPVYCRVQHGVKEPQCGRCLWESGWQRVPLDEGQASLGEALVTVHTCRLLLQPRRRLQVQSPTGNRCPREGRTIHGGRILQCF